MTRPFRATSKTTDSQWNTGWGTQSRQKCPWKKQAYVFAGCAFALCRLLMGCLKTLLRPKSTILIFLCSSRRRFSGLSHVQRWHEHRGTKIKKITLHSHTYRRTNLYSLSQQNSNHFFLTEGKQRPRLQVPVHDVHGVNLKWQCGTVQCCA